MFHRLDRVGNEIDEHMEELIRVSLRDHVRLVVLPNLNVLEGNGVASDLQGLIELTVDADESIWSK